MKPLALVFAMLLAGCSTMTPEHSAALQAASDRYAKVSVEMTREQLVRLLGPPQREEAQLLVWEVRFGRDNFESLRVEFDAEKHVARITEAHSRFRWGRIDPIARGFPDDASKYSGYVETSGWVLPARAQSEENRQPSKRAYPPDASSLPPLPASAPLTAEEQQKEAEARFPFVIPCEFQPADQDFAAGDNISITAVRGNRKHIEPGGAYRVEGTYRLESAAMAGLALSLTTLTPTPDIAGPRGHSVPGITGDFARDTTTPPIRPPNFARQHLRVARGSGEFALEANMSTDGDYHVSFYFLSGSGHTEARGGVYLQEVLSPAEMEANFPYEVPCRFEISTDDALSSDQVGVTAVRENRKQILVEGTYKLQSAAQATLALVLTTPNDTPALSGQQIRVARGTGHFALRADFSAAGVYRVTLYGPGGAGYTVHIIEE